MSCATCDDLTAQIALLTEQLKELQARFDKQSETLAAVCT